VVLLHTHDHVVRFISQKYMEIILGVFVSLLVEGIKKKFGAKGWASRAILLGVALVSATIYWALATTGYWEIILKVLVIAGAFYAFVIRAFEQE